MHDRGASRSTYHTPARSTLPAVPSLSQPMHVCRSRGAVLCSLDIDMTSAFGELH